MTSSVKPTTVKQATQASQLQGILDRLVQPKKLKENPLLASEIKFLLESVKKQLKASRTALVEIEELPINIAGDTHGQYRDVLRLFDTCGWPPANKYLFLGDYVDRGRRSVEVACLVLALKLSFPNRVFALRGNHESKEINKFYGFYDEVKSRYNEQLWHDFNEVFTWMPVAALVGSENQKIFCMHGGIPANLKSMDDIRKLQLPIQSPRDSAIVADLLWSDPSEDIEGFQNNPRGLGHQFGEEVLEDFAVKHGLFMVCRAHQVFQPGWKFFAGKRCLTVFSAPNYGGEFYNNAACAMIGDDSVCKIKVLEPFVKK